MKNKLKLLLAIFCLQPVMSMADYDHLLILNELKANKVLFGDLRENVSESMWVFGEKMSGRSTIVYKTKTAISNIIGSKVKTAGSIERCMIIANTALQPETNDQKKKIRQVITDATFDGESEFVLNNVTFKASTSLLPTVSILLCSVEAILGNSRK